jgi:hypothetical protein
LGWHAAGQIGADGFHASANVFCLIVAGPANYFVTPNLENQIECSQNFMMALFTFHPNPKYFLFHPSHQIFRRMHGTLNVGKKDN